MALLLVSELVTNAVLHGQPKKPRDLVTLEIVRCDSTLHVGVTSTGTFRSRSGPREPGGYGLQVVEQFSDDWGIEELDGSLTRVWFSLENALW